MNTTTIPPRGRAGRLAYATLAAVLLAGLAIGAIIHSSYWQIAVSELARTSRCSTAAVVTSRRDSCTLGRCRFITSFIASGDHSL